MSSKKEINNDENALNNKNESEGLTLDSSKITQEQSTTNKELPLEALQADLLNENQKLKDGLKELENQYLRSVADYQNLQKRSLQEKEELYKYASQKTIEILLPALDTFDYAKQTLKPDSKIEKVIEDFSLVFEMLLKCLKDIGLEPIDEAGIPFNPTYHEPLHQIPSNELPDHTIVQVLKKGYLLNKKIIRPALVSVSVKQEDKQENK